MDLWVGSESPPPNPRPPARDTDKGPEDCSELLRVPWASRQRGQPGVPVALHVYAHMHTATIWYPESGNGYSYRLRAQWMPGDPYDSEPARMGFGKGHFQVPAGSQQLSLTAALTGVPEAAGS
ncbi:hypothetical protein H920_10362 [Fukomys damarensis]|uniref:Uncharacterized protein n=1 Tax=Fukomys damarensis TaxID=885580 RepID=A0A091DZM6_FUKDA|nr:hypothetical protein H920_10362 [Fukomys damarensis]